MNILDIIRRHRSAGIMPGLQAPTQAPAAQTQQSAMGVLPAAAPPAAQSATSGLPPQFGAINPMIAALLQRAQAQQQQPAPMGRTPQVPIAKIRGM